MTIRDVEPSAPRKVNETGIGWDFWLLAGLAVAAVIVLVVAIAESPFVDWLAGA